MKKMLFEDRYCFLYSDDKESILNVLRYENTGEFEAVETTWENVDDIMYDLESEAIYGMQIHYESDLFDFLRIDSYFGLTPEDVRSVMNDVQRNRQKKIDAWRKRHS